jgi:peptide/nickel transport system permease protein
MQRYILGRLLQSLLTLFCLTVLVFSLIRLTGSPLNVVMPMEATKEDFERTAKYLGLDKPLPVQYALWVGRVLRGDFGMSIQSRAPASQLIMNRLPNSLSLAAFTMVFALSTALVLGVGAAVYKGSILDSISRVMAVAGMSIPAFWLGIMAILIFSARFNLLPAFGAGGIKHYILPGAVLGWTFSAALTRLLRSSTLEVLDSEYVKFARIKGISEVKVIWWHALRNSLIPLITFAGVYMGILIGGVVIIETVFAWPGLGSLVYEAVVLRDYPVIQGVTLVIGASVLTINLVVDILYAYLDPRIRY